MFQKMLLTAALAAALFVAGCGIDICDPDCDCCDDCECYCECDCDCYCVCDDGCGCH